MFCLTEHAFRRWRKPQTCACPACRCAHMHEPLLRCASLCRLFTISGGQRYLAVPTSARASSPRAVSPMRFSRAAPEHGECAARGRTAMLQSSALENPPTGRQSVQPRGHEGISGYRCDSHISACRHVYMPRLAVQVSIGLHVCVGCELDGVSLWAVMIPCGDTCLLGAVLVTRAAEPRVRSHLQARRERVYVRSRASA